MATAIKLVEIRRVSTEEQARDDRSGLERQASFNAATAKRVGGKIIETVIVTDVSRESFAFTPEWQRIRALIQDPQTHILVDMQDRVAGSLEALPILIEFRRTNTLIYHKDGIVDPSTLAGQVMGVLQAIFSGNELSTIRHRVQGAKEVRRRQGIFVGAAVALPTGVAYERSKGQKAGRWAYNERIAIVRDIYRLVVEEGHRNWREVARLAGASNGVTVRNVLRNPIYMGWWIVDEKRQPGPTPTKPDGRRADRKKIARPPEDVIRVQVFRPKGQRPEPGDEREEAVVDAATWDWVQTVADGKREAWHRPREPKGESRFTYTGLIFCAACGAPLWSKTRPPGGRIKVRRDHYVCPRGRKCGTKFLQRKVVNSAIDRLFTTVFSDERFVAKLVAAGLEADRQDFTGQITEISVKLKKVEGQRAKLLDLYLDDGLPKAELNARRLRLDGDREKLGRELRRLKQAQRAGDHAAITESLRDALLALAEFEFWTTPQKRDFLRRLFPRIELSKGGIERVHLQVPSTLISGGRSVTIDRDTPMVLSVEMSWEQLEPPVAMAEFGLPVKELYTRGDLAKVLGLTDGQVVEAIKRGDIPNSKQRSGHHHAWTIDEVRAIIAASAAANTPYRWGLPKKPWYTSGDVARIACVHEENLRTLIKRGKLRDVRRRAPGGQRLWSEKEIEATLEALSVPR